jgi:hypothetical protein
MQGSQAGFKHPKPNREAERLAMMLANTEQNFYQWNNVFSLWLAIITSLLFLAPKLRNIPMFVMLVVGGFAPFVNILFSLLEYFTAHGRTDAFERMIRLRRAQFWVFRVLLVIMVAAFIAAASIYFVYFDS